MQQLAKRLSMLVSSLVLACALTACNGVSDASLAVVSDVEYGKASSPATEYVSCSDESAHLSSDDLIDTSQIGPHTASITIEKGLSKRTETVDLTVRDTAAPVIEVADETTPLEVGDEFDPANYLVSVNDPIDGPLDPVDTAPGSAGTKVGVEVFYDQGWYIVQDNVDMSHGGSYSIRVHAEDRHGNASDARIRITVEDPLQGVTLKTTEASDAVEYGTKPIDPLTLVSCSDEDTKVLSEELIPTSVGIIDVDYTLSKGKSTRTTNVQARVVDTQAPSVELEKKVRVELGESFDPLAHITSVNDPVDGDLALVDAAPKTDASHVGSERFYDSGWYRIKGAVDTDTPGTYTLKLIAADQHGNKTKKKMRVRVVDPLDGLELTPKTTVLEYSTKKTDPTKLITCSIKGAKVSADKIDLSKLGKRTVRYVVTKGNSIRNVEVDFEVRDTKKPVISFKKLNPHIEYGGSFSARDNIEYVRDEVDGDLEFTWSGPSDSSDGWYTIDGTHDNHRAGTYTYTVVACDRNGNRTTREMSMTVDPEPEPVVVEYDYVVNTNTGKFHNPRCYTINSMSASNRWDVHTTRDQLIAQGYSPCQVCCP
jgi:hypothetical protein